jgi:NADH-quinone oxidoreductase subunit C
LELLSEKFPDFVISSDEVNGEIHAEVTGTGLIPVCKFLRDEEGFDYPADLCAWDTGEEIIVWYRLYSMSANATVILKVHLLRDRAEAPSVTSIWKGMNWHERECFDLLGIDFIGHPDSGDPEQMRILLPEDWEGHPFRKDYVPVFTGNPLHGPQETN